MPDPSLSTQSDTAENPDVSGYVASERARKASDYYNSLPYEERVKLAPLLDHYRQMGLAEAEVDIRRVSRKLKDRIRGIRDAD